MVTIALGSPSAAAVNVNDGDVNWESRLSDLSPYPTALPSSPPWKLGIWQDSGDAESGFGLDLGAGILWQALERGISGALKGHTLLAHREETSRNKAWPSPSPGNPIAPIAVPPSP